MIHLYGNIAANPLRYRQLRCGDALISKYNCPLENAYQDVWSEHSYFVYVVEGRKVWHTTDGSFDLREGTCVLVRKGACIVEQNFDVTFCLVIFFVTDEFICDVLRTKSTPVQSQPGRHLPVIPMQSSPGLQSFFLSMMPYFESSKDPDQSLLDLKFRELILTIAEDPENTDILSYFSSLLKSPQCISLQSVMEDNFCYNLSLAEFARLSSRSLSAFKRDFMKVYNCPPGKWLMGKRLNHAKHLLTNLNRTVAEASFESGFESSSHFSRAFRLRFGKTPIEVKQAAKLPSKASASYN